MGEPIKVNSKTSLLECVQASAGPDDIIDAFCYVSGYLEAELEMRIERLAGKEKPTKDDLKTIEAYRGRLAQLNAGWAAFHDADPERTAAGRAIRMRQIPPKKAPARPVAGKKARKGA